MSSSVTEPAPEITTTPERGAKAGSGSLWLDARRDLLRKPMFLIALFVMLTVVSWAAFPRLWTSDPECAVAINRQPPTWWPGALPPG